MGHTFTFEHPLTVDGQELRKPLLCTVEYEPGDPGCGQPAGYFLREAVACDAIILDRQQVARHLGLDVLQSIEAAGETGVAQALESERTERNGR